MFTTTLIVSKPFMIKNRAGNIIYLPRKYKLVCEAQSYTNKKIESCDIVAEADGDRIEEKTIINNVPWSYVTYLTFEDDPN